MKRKQSGQQVDNSKSGSQSSTYEVLHLRMDQFSAYQFMKTLRNHAGHIPGSDEPQECRQPEFAVDHG